MPKVFRHTEWMSKIAPMLQSVSDVVAGRAAPESVDIFWQTDKKPEEARAGLARLAFDAACHTGNTKNAEWLKTRYATHIKASEFKAAVLKSMERGDDHTALWLIQNMPQACTDENQKNKLVGSLLAPALQISRLVIVKALTELQDRPDSSLLYRAALGGQIDNLRYMIGRCKERKTLMAEDLNAALVVSVKQGDAQTMACLLGAGADAGAPREAPLKRAAERFSQDGFSMIGQLLTAGADPVLAKKLLPSQISAIDACAQKAQEDHRAKLQRATGFDADALRRHQNVLGTTGLHYAAEHRVFDHVVLSKMTADDFLIKNVQGETVLAVIEKRNDVAALLQPARWVGQVEMLRHVLPHLSAKTQESLDVRQLLLDVDMQTLRQKARGLSLKPKGFRPV